MHRKLLIAVQRTPRPASSIQPWLAPVRNHDWMAALIGLG